MRIRTRSQVPPRVMGRRGARRAAQPRIRSRAACIMFREGHMTNTRITDPEVLETCFPARLERFEIRRGSSGHGQWSGGDGLIPQYRSLKPVEVSFLTQRRALAPFGLQGGEAGAKGKNLRLTAAGERAELPGATSYATEAGEGLIIETAGAGGWGAPE
jgi:5-oxoprolinase (ATP-hydrolysing)